MDFTGLTDGLTFEFEALEDRRARISWDEAVVVIERLSDRLGGELAYAKMIASMVDSPQAIAIQRFFRIASTPLRNYQLVFKWVGPLMYPFLHSSVQLLDGHSAVITTRIPAELPGSRPFMLSAVELARALPRMHGLGDAHVTADFDSHSARIVVRPPTTLSVMGRVRRWGRLVSDTPSFFEELVVQQRDLLESYTALETAYAEGRERERLLAAEMAAREAAQVQLASRDAQLLHSQRLESVGRLAGGVAHDFNNLLTVILGQSSYLRGKTNEAETKAGLADIEYAARRGAGLTRQLLTFARRQPAKQQSIELNGFVGGLEGLLSRVLNGQAIAIQRSDAPLYIVADDVQLEQVLINLAVNAGDAMPAGGTLTVRIETSEPFGEHCARLVVSDTGTGMSPYVLEHLFEPFFTTKGDAGTGLGLATVYGIVTEAGGAIEADSTVGEGTRFVIDWPLDSAPAASAAAEPEGLVGGRPAAVTILVIEDEAAIRLLIESALVASGHTVRAASNRGEAHAFVESEVIDLVISDVMLDGDRGPAIVSALFEAPRPLQLYISGAADPVGMLEVGDADFLTKPFTMRSLVDKVDVMLRLRDPTSRRP